MRGYLLDIIYDIYIYIYMGYALLQSVSVRIFGHFGNLDMGNLVLRKR